MLWPFASLGPGAGAQQPLAKPFFGWRCSECIGRFAPKKAPSQVLRILVQASDSKLTGHHRMQLSGRWPATDSDQAVMKTPCWLFETGVELFFVQGTYIVRVPINYPFWWNVKRFWTCAKRTDLAFIIRIFGAIVIVHLSWNLCVAMTLVALKLFAFVFLSAVQLRATFQNCQDSQCIKGCRSGSTTLVAGMIRFYPGAIVASAFGKDIVSAMELYLANLGKTFL